MRIAATRLAAFLRDPGTCRVVLLFGDDTGMIRGRAEELVRAVAGSLDDPFTVAQLRRDQIDALPGEAASQPLTGGRRVVVVRDVTDAAAIGPVQAVLNSPATALVVLEAPGLPSRTKLRTLLDAAPDGAAIPCYPEQGAVLDEAVRQVLGASGVEADAETVRWMSSQLGGDYACTRSELEKLILYAGADGHATLDMAMQCIGDAAGLSLDDALFAATAGDVTTADRALELAAAQGATPVGMVRSGLMHLQRLFRARLLVDDGMSAGAAAKEARPPVFAGRLAAFTRALTLWPSASLAGAMARLSRVERSCKRTGAPDHALSRHAILALAAQAAQQSRRQGERDRRFR